MFQIEQLCKSYRRHQAVDGLSLSLPPGSVCGFVGANGAGKTTTLRCIAGLLAADSGRIEIEGHGVSGIDPEYKRRVMYVPDDPPLFDDLTVADHMELIDRLYRVDGQPDDVATELLERFELSHKRDACGGELSRRACARKLAIAHGGSGVPVADASG